MKKSLISVLLATMLLATTLTACNTGGQTTPTTSKTGNATEASGDESATEGSGDASNADQKIIWAVHNEADSLDPGFTSNTFAAPVLINAFEPLVTYDSENNLIPGLAESWDISEDGLTYTFKLRPDLKWSDGSPLTAEDFAYSWFRVLDPALAAQYSNILTDYIVGAKEFFEGTGKKEDVGIKVIDPQTISLNIMIPTPFYLDLLSMYPYNAVKKDVVEGNADTWAKDAATYVSNGPFKVSKIKLGEGVTLVKNENYWNAENVKLEEIQFRYIPEQSTALTAFESGEIDGIYEVPTDDIPRLKTESEDMYVIPQFATTYFIMNLDKEPFNDPKVRKALSLAIDRDSLIQNVLQNSDLPATGIVAPGYMVEGEDFIDSRPDFDILPEGNLEMAKQLLAEAGYPNGEGFPQVTLSYYTNPIVKKYTEALQQMWKKNLGIDMKIATEEWKVYYDGIKAGNYDIAAMGWGGDYLHPMTFLAGFASDSELNNSKYNNPAYDELLKKINAEIDPVKGADLMHQAESILIGDDHAVINLFYRSRYVMFAPTVEGWFLTPLNNIYFKDAVELG